MSTASPLTKAVLVAVFVAYLLVLVGSALGGTVVTDPLREALTRPVEKVLGIHQTWPMFEVAPRRTVWLEIEVTRPDGAVERVDYLPGRPDPQGIRATYDRLGKFQRQASSKRRERVRMGIVRWVCRSERAAGRDVAKVQMIKYTSRTPPPGSGRVPRSDFHVRREAFKRWNCP